MMYANNFGMKRKSHSFFLFILGLFSFTRISLGGSIAISEVLLVAYAPFIYVQKINYFKDSIVSKLILLSVLWLAGAIFSDFSTGRIRGLPVYFFKIR